MSAATATAEPLDASQSQNIPIDQALARPTVAEEGRSIWLAVGLAIAQLGMFLGRKTIEAGKAVIDAAETIDADARRHIVELPVMALSSLTSRKCPVKPLADDGFRPMLFVHGLAGHPGNLGMMRSYFALCGRTRAYAIDLSAGESFEELAARMRETIARIIEVNGLGDDAKIDIVAHSMGGVVSRLAVDDPVTRARVGTIVTLGSPHNGTVLARFIGEGARTAIQLRPDSATMERLRLQLPWDPAGGWPRLVSMWSQS
ncbi:MAG: alpha/beta fold hydrolase, partial [Phycisphaerales bacterium]|nr:alpha/beta fold hydrolase [Phycisphaerales bacterium]